MRAASSAVFGAILLALAPMPAFAHHKLNHGDPFSRAEATRDRDPCGAVSNNPRELSAQQAMQRVMQQKCQRLHAELRERPGESGLRDRCDRLARGLTGVPC